MPPQSYTWNATDYAIHSSAQYTWAQELLTKLDLTGTEHVLDIGCGDGKITAAIAQRVPGGHVTGIDYSKDMISFAQQCFPKSEYNNADFFVMDATQLTFNHQFDVAFSNAVLHWIHDHVSVLRGVKRSLKRGGRLLFQMGGQGNAQDIIVVLNELLAQDRWSAYFKHFSFPYAFYSPAEYHIWLQQTGLREKRVELIPKDMKHKGSEALTGWIRTTWLPYLERIPSHLRDEFVSEVVDSYVKHHPADAQGYIHVRMMRLEVEAVNAGS